MVSQLSVYNVVHRHVCYLKNKPRRVREDLELMSELHEQQQLSLLSGVRACRDSCKTCTASMGVCGVTVYTLDTHMANAVHSLQVGKHVVN